MSTTPSIPNLSSTQLEVVLDSVSDAVFTVDRNFVITSFNRAAETITHVPRARAMGRHCYDVMHSASCHNDRECPILQIWRGEQPSLDKVFQVRTFANKDRFLRVCVGALRNDAGEIVGAVESFHDAREVVLRASEPTDGEPGALPAEMSILEASERRTIEEVLRRHNWNRSTTSRELGLSRTTLWRKMRKLGISDHAPGRHEENA